VVRFATSRPRLRSRRGDPFALCLIAGAIDVHRVIDLSHPGERNEVMLSFVVLCELDAVRALHVIDDGKLSAVRANDGRVRLDFAGLDHIHLESTIHAAFVARAPAGNTGPDTSVSRGGLVIASGEAHACRLRQTPGRRVAPEEITTRLAKVRPD
jgi:hypothetical protein